MTSRENLLPGHPGGRPASPPLKESVYRHFAISPLPRPSGDHVSNGLPMARDRDGLAVFDIAQQLGEPCSGLGSLNLAHCTLPTGRFD